MSHRLPEVVGRELRVVPVGACHVAVGQVGQEDGRAGRPSASARGQMLNQALVVAVAPDAHDEGPRL